MSSLSIGLSALIANQRALDVTGQNVANANTPGYHRQVVELEPRSFGLVVGDGVNVARISRTINDVLEQTLNRGNSTSANVSTQLAALQQVQSMLSPGDGSLGDQLQAFFTAADQLSARPDDLTQRQSFLAAASSLTGTFNGLASDLNNLQSSMLDQTRQTVDSINSLVPQIADLNSQIQRATLKGIEANDLKDQRDQLITKISSLINVQTVAEDFGQIGVIAAGIPVVLGNTAIPLQMSVDAKQQSVTITAAGSSQPLAVSGGQLGGLLEVRGQILPNLQQQIEQMAQQLIQGMDQIHAAAIPLDGPMALVVGQRGVTNTTVPLAQAGLSFPPQAGTLYVSVTNDATGVRSLTAVAIDPATQSLQDVASALSAVPNMQAVVDPATRTLRILAAKGYGVDFAGQLPTAPDTTSITGTSTAQLAGAYTAAANDRYTFRVVGSGTVGVSANLSLEVRGQAGALLGSFNIGQGYEPGSVLTTVNGVGVRLSSGTVNNGDSFATSVVANSDTSGVLTALGLNSFFQGDTAGTVQVRADLAADAKNLAVSRTGQPADGGSLQQIAALRNAPLLGAGQQSLEQFFSSLLGATGASVQQLTQQSQAQDTLTQRLQAEQQSVSGVDSNEELVRLTQYQRAFQMAARYVSTIDQTMNDLLQILQESSAPGPTRGRQPTWKFAQP